MSVFNRLSINRGGAVPNLVVAQRVIDRMMAAVKNHIEDETGEAMVGLVVPGTYTNGVPTLYVLDTISPDESAVRMMHTFQQGDERQDELIWWLQENWHLSRQQRKTDTSSSKWDVPLRYLGDWHKQPGFMIQPSGGDLMTAIDWIEDPDNHTDFLLAPIVTLGHPHTLESTAAITNFIMIPQDENSAVRVDFWYIDRQTQMFMPITPTIYPDDQLPTLPSYPWHLVDESRFNAEHRALEDDGLFTSLTLWDADGQPPLEICFLTARLGTSKMLILITPHDYPKNPPRARLAPFVQMHADDDMYDVFQHAWDAADSFEYTPDGDWSSEDRLIDFVHTIEQKAGLQQGASS